MTWDKKDLKKKIKEVLVEKYGRDKIRKLLELADNGIWDKEEELRSIIEQELVNWIYAYCEFLTEIKSAIFDKIVEELVDEIDEYIYKEWEHGNL
jgi:DNA-binding transcriptional ArsR family regulator